MIKGMLNKPGYLIIAVAIFLLLLGYQFAFRQTIEACQINKEFHRQLESGEELVTQPGLIKRKIVNLEHALNLYKVDTAAYRSKLITTMSLLGEKHSLRMTEIPIAMTDTTQYGQQHRVVLEGSYQNMIRFLNDAEKSKGCGQVRSTIIYLEKTGVAEKNELKIQLYFSGM